MKKIAFLINGTIKRRSSVVKDIESAFDGHAIQIYISEYAGHLSEMSMTALEKGYDHFITVGGDGSLNETLNGLLRSLPEDGYTSFGQLKLGLIPGGSGNDFARYHQLKYDPKKLRQWIDNESALSLDIGKAEFTGKNGQLVQRHFFNITDVGMGGHTVQHMEKHRLPWLSSNLNYMKAIASSFFTYEKSSIVWTSEQTSWEGKIMSLVVANGKFFGSGLGIAPQSDMTDGKLTLVTLGDITLMDYVKNLSTVKQSKLMEHPEVSYHQVERIKIEATDGKEIPIDMDGDFVGYCPLEIECIPAVANFIIG